MAIQLKKIMARRKMRFNRALYASGIEDLSARLSSELYKQMLLISSNQKELIRGYVRSKNFKAIVDEEFWTNIFKSIAQSVLLTRDQIKSMEAEYLKLFNASGKFALNKIGAGVVDFNLKNPYLRQSLTDRVTTFYQDHAQSLYDRGVEIIEKHYIEQGAGVYDSDFVRQIRKDLEYETTWQARRYARTEAGVIANQAQYETFKENEVEGLEWDAAAFGDRRSNHQDLNGKKIKMGENFTLYGEDGGVYNIPYPQHSSLPAGETINCACDVIPFFYKDYERPKKVWSGQ